MSRKLSETQLALIARMRAAAPEPLVRLPGGFWVTRGTPTRPDGTPIERVWCEIRTVRALEREGVLVRCNVHPEAWRDERRLADAWANRPTSSPSAPPLGQLAAQAVEAGLRPAYAPYPRRDVDQW